MQRRRFSPFGRAGTSFVEALVAAVLGAMILGMVGVGVWSWARRRTRLEVHEKALSVGTSRLERLASLPEPRRPPPGTYFLADVEENPDWAKILEARAVRGVDLRFELVVEEHPVAYRDYFFGGAEPIPYLDFRIHRLRIHGESLRLELAVLK